MNRYDLSDFEWSMIERLLPNKPRGGRRVLNGIMRVLTPEHSLARLAGTLRALGDLIQPLQSLTQEGHPGSPDGRHRRSLRRPHTDDRQVHCPCSPARSGVNKGEPDCYRGRSRGGLTTRIRAVVDASGLSLRFALSPGRVHDNTLAGPLLEGQLPPDGFVCADKACDAEWIRARMEAQDAVPIIPDRGIATAACALSPALYRKRNRVERFFNKLKQFRRIVTRSEKLAANFLAMIEVATIRTRLRANESKSC